MPVQSLYIENVGPFTEIGFDFDPQVNVFIGPNNSGKSTALCALGETTVYPFLFPTKLLRTGQETTFRIQLAGAEAESWQGRFPVWADPSDAFPEPRKEHAVRLAKIGYSQFIPALRWCTDFRLPGPRIARTQDGEIQIPVRLDDAAGYVSAAPRANGAPRQWQRQASVFPELKKRLALGVDDAHLIKDISVVQTIVELDGRFYRQGKPQRGHLMDRVCQIASAITEDFPIEFLGIDADDDGFYPKFQTIDGPVPFHTLSQGTQSLMQWLARLVIGYAEYYDYAEDWARQPGLLIVDEIDAHLHPSWQRRIIPALTQHFPQLQIFCSTRSPLVVAGLRAGQVQRLRRDPSGQVTVSPNEKDVAGWTADEILRRFLGIADPTDLQAAERLERLSCLQLQKNLSPAEDAERQALRQTVSQDLLQGALSPQLEYFSEVLRQVNAADSPDR